MSETPKPNGHLRDRMPGVAAFVDEMREAFGTAYVNGIIRGGIAGAPESFYAQEGDAEIGTPWDSSGGVEPCVVRGNRRGEP